MSEFYLHITVDDDSDSSEGNGSSKGNDTVMIPADIWEQINERRSPTDTNPLWASIELNQGSAVGRIMPALPHEHLPSDACRIPRWMWRLLGSPKGFDEDMWIRIVPCSLPVAGRIVLRARNEEELLSLEDPASSLTIALSGGDTGISWSCLNVGAELSMGCGIFDIMELWSVEGEQVVAASVVDVDVGVEFMPALDHVSPLPLPLPLPLPPPPPPAAPLPLPLPPPSATTTKATIATSTHPKGFVPFSGVGRRLRD